MQEVADAFLLNMAEVSSALAGLFRVGIFFYVETGLRRVVSARPVLEPYLRASTTIVPLPTPSLSCFREHPGQRDHDDDSRRPKTSSATITVEWAIISPSRPGS